MNVLTVTSSYPKHPGDVTSPFIESIAEALAEGGAVHAEIGPDWVLFDPWQGTRPGAISRWCKIAHDHAVAPPERRDR